MVGLYTVELVFSTPGCPLICKIFAGREVVVKLFTPLSLLVDTLRKSFSTLGVKIISSPPTPLEATASTSPAPLLILVTNAVTTSIFVSPTKEV